MGTCLNHIGKALLTNSHNLCFEANVIMKIKYVHPCTAPFYFIKMDVRGIYITLTCILEVHFVVMASKMFLLV